MITESGPADLKSKHSLVKYRIKITSKPELPDIKSDSAGGLVEVNWNVKYFSDAVCNLSNHKPPANISSFSSSPVRTLKHR